MAENVERISFKVFHRNALTQKPLKIVGDGSAKGGLYILKIWQELML